MKIWDLHCHLPSQRVAGETLSEQIGSMLEIGGRVGVEKLCLFLRTEREDGHPSDDEIRRALAEYEGRVFGFVWVDLANTEEAVVKVRRWLRDGPMVGLKLGGKSGVSSKLEYDRVFREAVDAQAVIFIHTWFKTGGDPRRIGGATRPIESTPLDVVELARRYTGYPFIAGHTGGDWEAGIRAVAPQSNVFVGIGGGYPTRGQVEMGVRELGAGRIIYGSDVTGRSFSSQIGKVYGAHISEAESRDIFFDNLHRIMKPILDRKGIDVL